jgi:hypothetical protein
LLSRQILDDELGVAPAYQTRIRDDIYIRPLIGTFKNAYQLLRLPTLTSKTRETAFQTLNRTIWTNNKAFKSNMRPDPNCDRCGEVETMEHLLCECQHYSLLLWERLGEVLTRLFTTLSQDYVPRVELSQLNVIYNVPHPSVLLYVHDKLTRNMILALIQEIKRDIIYRRMNLPPSARQIVLQPRLAAHLDSTFRRLSSYFQYIGLAKYKKVIETLDLMRESNVSGVE